MEDWTAIGVGGIFALLVLRSVFDFLGRRSGNGVTHWEKTIDAKIREFEICREVTAAQVRDLHTWHAPDGNGEQAWRNQSLIELVQRVSDAVDNNTKTLDKLMPILDRLLRSDRS